MWDVLIAGVIAYILYYFYNRYARTKREAYIQSYKFPLSIKEKVKDRYPHLDDRDLSNVISGLKEYFFICNTAGRRLVSMPSQAVDAAWHEFILFTRAYDDFCRRGLGRFLHHTPAEAMKSPTRAQNGIKRTWRLCCAREGINPKSPARLPLLFALDADLNIPDGLKFSLNCRGPNSHPYCAGDIGCGGGCSGDSGDGDGGCGGGCGGD